ncbi:MAG: energy-coupled thiamine transporter ThiT [Lachnoclostridium sp.]|nr:energy-coupled thiamine transporter ThiT [Lachnospira sp.]MCM1247404.1 energy-coupled thiamine transporter ThiT [Lachnoclostridium sp.]
MSMFFHFNQEDGYYSLTTPGMILFIAVFAAFLLLTAFFKNKTKENTEAASRSGLFSTKQLVFSAAALALGFITSYIKIIHMPWGGSVTLCSMLFIALIGYWYGPKIGIAAGFAYGILQFLQGGGDYILSPLQACMDYIFAFASLGLSGLFYQKKNGLLKGYLLAVFCRGIFHSIGGYLYWMDYMPDNFPKSLAGIYPIAYNYAYLLLEAAITIILILLPPVKNAMARVKAMAQEA